MTAFYNLDALRRAGLSDGDLMRLTAEVETELVLDEWRENWPKSPVLYTTTEIKRYVAMHAAMFGMAKKRES